MTINIPTYMDTKTAKIHLLDQDSGAVHASWESGNGQIIAFNHYPPDYPATSVSTYSSNKEYAKDLLESWTRGLLSPAQIGALKEISGN